MVASQFYSILHSTQPPELVAATQARMGGIPYSQSGAVIMAPAPPASGTTATMNTHAPQPKQKKILSIVDPETKEVTNREELMRLQQQETRGSQECLTANDSMYFIYFIASLWQFSVDDTRLIFIQ